MLHPPGNAASATQLFALRLSPGAPRSGLQGEVEHVVTGDRFQFGDAAALVRWLQERACAAGGEAPGIQAAEPPEPAARDATRYAVQRCSDDKASGGTAPRKTPAAPRAGS